MVVPSGSRSGDGADLEVSAIGAEFSFGAGVGVGAGFCAGAGAGLVVRAADGAEGKSACSCADAGDRMRAKLPRRREKPENRIGYAPIIASFSGRGR